MARKWKKRKLAEIKIDGVQTVSRSGDTLAEAITARLATHKSLGRSAKQQLGWLKGSKFGKKKLTDLSLEDLIDLADDMRREERQPQTVAGYLTICVNTLDWASRRGFIIPVAALRQAMEHMWEDEILARSEERDRRPTIDELDEILGAVVENKRQEIPRATVDAVDELIRKPSGSTTNSASCEAGPTSKPLRYRMGGLHAAPAGRPDEDGPP